MFGKRQDEDLSPVLTVCRGDDMDFSRNCAVFLTVLSEVDISGLKLHFHFFDFCKTIDEVPESGEIEIVFTAEDTKGFPLGLNYATVWLEDDNGKRRTVTKKLLVNVTHDPDIAYSPCALVFDGK